MVFMVAPARIKVCKCGTQILFLTFDAGGTVNNQIVLTRQCVHYFVRKACGDTGNGSDSIRKSLQT